MWHHLSLDPAIWIFPFIKITCLLFFNIWASFVAQLVKNLPVMQEIWIQSLYWKDPLEKQKALQYSGLENSMDCIVHAVANSWTRLSKFHFTSFLIFKLLLHFMGFPGGSDSKKFACYAGDLGPIPGLRRSPGGGHGNPLQYSCLGESQWTEEPSGLQFMGSQRVWHNWTTKHITFYINQAFRLAQKELKRRSSNLLQRCIFLHSKGPPNVHMSNWL